MRSKTNILLMGAAQALAFLSIMIPATEASSRPASPPQGQSSVLVSITVTASTSSVTVGGTQQFTAIGRYRDNSARDITAEVIWDSDNDSVAKVNGSGLATGQKAGSTTITAAHAGIEGSATVTVLAGSTVSLPVLVLDSGGNKVSGARINIYQEHNAGSYLLAKPPDYDKLSGGDGTATFRILVKDGEKLKLSIEVSRDGMQTNRLDDLQFAPDTIRSGELPQQTVTLQPMGSPGADSVLVTFTVRDQVAHPVAGVKVTVTNSMQGKFEGITGSDGSVRIPVPLTHTANIYYTSYPVQASKAGYENGGEPIILYEKDAGKTVSGGTIQIVKDENATPAPTQVVAIQVVDDQNGRGVSGARVQLDGPGHYSETTDPDGNLNVTVKDFGNYSVQISQEYYESGGGTIQVAEDIQPAIPPFKLKQKPKKDENTIQVTVLTKDPTDPSSQPNPVPGAAVSDGRNTVPTDGDGHATLKGTYDSSPSVTVSANGYKSKTQNVPIANAALSDGVSHATFTLDPDLSENRPLLLYIHVRDSDDNPIPAARVSFFTPDGRPLGDPANANSSGNAFFGGPKAGGVTDAEIYQQGMTINVKADGYKPIESRSITKDFLKPSVQALTYEVQMELSDDAPIHLYFETKDAGGNGVPSDVSIFLAGGPIVYGDRSTGDGVLEFRSGINTTRPASDLRRGLTVNVSSPGYKPVSGLPVPADLLQPTTSAKVFVIKMEKDWSALANAIAELEGQVKAWRSGYDAQFSTDSVAGGLINQILTARNDAEQLRVALETAQSSLRNAPGFFGLTLGSHVQQLQEHIQDIAAQMSGKETELNVALNDATADAGQCMTAADAAAVRNNYSEATQLLIEIADLKKKADSDRNDLVRYGHLRAAFQDLLKDDGVQIEILYEMAEEAGVDLRDHYDHLGLMTSGNLQAKLNGELQTLNQRFFSETAGVDRTQELQSLRDRLSAMETMLNPPSSGATPAPTVIPQNVADALRSIEDAHRFASALANEPDDTNLDLDLSETAAKIEGTLSDASLAVGLSSDLPQQAADCAAKASAAGASAAPAGVTAKPEPLPEDQPSSTAPVSRTTTDSTTLSANSGGASPGNCAPPDVTQQVEALLSQAADATPFPAADLYLSRAEVLAAPYPCLDARVKSLEGTISNVRLTSKAPAASKASSGLPNENGPFVDVPNPTQPRTVEGLPEDNPISTGNSPTSWVNTSSLGVVTAGRATGRTVESIPEDMPGASRVALATTNPPNVPPERVEAIPEDTPQPAAPTPPYVPTLAPATRAPRDPNQPSGWNKTGIILGGIIQGLNAANQGTGSSTAQNPPNAPPAPPRTLPPVQQPTSVPQGGGSPQPTRPNTPPRQPTAQPPALRQPAAPANPPASSPAGQAWIYLHVVTSCSLTNPVPTGFSGATVSIGPYSTVTGGGGAGNVNIAAGNYGIAVTGQRVVSVSVTPTGMYGRPTGPMANFAPGNMITFKASPNFGLTADYDVEIRLQSTPACN